MPYENGTFTPGPPGPPGTYAYDVCDPNSPNYDPVACKKRITAAGHPSDWPGYKNLGLPTNHKLGGMSDDWWSGTGIIGPRNRYEEILESLRGRSIADPHQQAKSFGADVLGGTSYDDMIENLKKMAGIVPGMDPYNKRKAMAGITPDINKILGERSRTFAGAAGGALGPATSMVQTGYRGLQGFRGQDQQRYLTEMKMEMQLKMLMAQLQAQAQQNQGGGLWDILGNILPLVSMFIPGVGPLGGALAGLFGGGGGSGGGIQYSPNWGFGGS